MKGGVVRTGKARGQWLTVSVRVRSQDIPFRFVMKKAEVEQFFLMAIQFSPVSIIPPLFHIHSSTTHTV